MESFKSLYSFCNAMRTDARVQFHDGIICHIHNKRTGETAAFSTFDSVRHIQTRLSLRNREDIIKRLRVVAQMHGWTPTADSWDVENFNIHMSWRFSFLKRHVVFYTASVNVGFGAGLSWFDPTEDEATQEVAIVPVERKC